ncbi:right-handed parallel beta-helix repeat-containing protein [Candidatus Dependentiae bacterium]|nr:right-handed parallel beta-helix repeat-containing protein [Candidatus Dependentiae bacterium]
MTLFEFESGLFKRFLLIFAMFAAMPVYAAVDPQPTDGIRQIMVKSSDEIDVIMSQVNIIEGNMPTPLDPSQNIVTTIDQPGSYVLTGSKVGGTIEIITSNVCLDLNGWTVEGTADGTPIISIDDSFVTVKNGLVRHGGATTAAADGAIEIVGNPRGVELRDLSIVITNTLTAINFSTAASECLVTDCVITGSPLFTMGTAGVRINVDPLVTGSGIIVENCQIEGFTYGVYLEQGNSLIVKDCFITESTTGISISSSCSGAVVSNNIILRPETFGIYDSGDLAASNSVFNNIIVGCRGFESTFAGDADTATYGNLAINYLGSSSHYNVNVPLQVSDLTTGTSIGEYANIALS